MVLCHRWWNPTRGNVQLLLRRNTENWDAESSKRPRNDKTKWKGQSRVFEKDTAKHQHSHEA